jgi:hypothetical protein
MLTNEPSWKDPPIEAASYQNVHQELLVMKFFLGYKTLLNVVFSTNKQNLIELVYSECECI